MLLFAILNVFIRFSDHNLACVLLCERYQDLYDDLIELLPDEEKYKYNMRDQKGYIDYVGVSDLLS